MLLKIYPENPNARHIRYAADVLKAGGVIIYPTDSVYGLGCDIKNHRAIERVAQIKGIRLDKANFSFICYDLSHLSEYTKNIDNNVFKVMRRNLPGPFTFILNASNRVPEIFKSKKKTVGIRIPDNSIIREIVLELGNPILTTSVHNDDSAEYTTDPELIHERYKDIVDLVIDGGFGKNTASTVVDCTGEQIEIVRQGIGELVL